MGTKQKGVNKTQCAVMIRNSLPEMEQEPASGITVTVELGEDLKRKHLQAAGDGVGSWE